MSVVNNRITKEDMRMYVKMCGEQFLRDIRYREELDRLLREGFTGGSYAMSAFGRSMASPVINTSGTGLNQDIMDNIASQIIKKQQSQGLRPSYRLGC